VPTTALINVVFASPEDGYALATHRGLALLAATTNGGTTWQVQDDQLPTGYGQANEYPGQIEFVGSHGYLWGMTPGAVSAPLWVTTDGGTSWQMAPIGPLVYDVSVIGTNVWALIGACTASSPATCALTLEQSVDGGASWQAGSALADVGGESSMTPPVELARITPRGAYILTSSPQARAGSNFALLYTADDGQTWQTRPVPCSGAWDLGAEMAASSTDDLWLLCGSQGSGGSQSKELYRSSDGGQTWALTASASGLGTPPPSASHPNSLPLEGFVAPLSIGHKNLAVAAGSETAWLHPSGAPMYKTTDGGQSWMPVPELEAGGLGSSDLGNITFISATQGWICAYGVGLWHTDDGMHWYPLGA
jgi:photosystem II stability/assembly factor-like uncharacterized protein